MPRHLHGGSGGGGRPLRSPAHSHEGAAVLQAGTDARAQRAGSCPGSAHGSDSLLDSCPVTTPLVPTGHLNPGPWWPQGGGTCRNDGVCHLPGKKINQRPKKRPVPQDGGGGGQAQAGPRSLAVARGAVPHILMSPGQGAAELLNHKGSPFAQGVWVGVGGLPGKLSLWLTRIQPPAPGGSHALSAPVCLSSRLGAGLRTPPRGPQLRACPAWSLTHHLVCAGMGGKHGGPPIPLHPVWPMPFGVSVGVG